MAAFPIVPAKTGMLFFDALNIYLHPENPEQRAAIEKSGVISRMQRMNQACRQGGIAVFYGQADHRPDYRDFWPHVVDGLPDTGEGPRKTIPPESREVPQALMSSPS